MERKDKTTASDEHAFVEWARGAAIPYAIPPSTEELNNLRFLDDVVGGTKVVFLGESSHYVREWNALRMRLFQFLVENHGFRIFVLETGLIEGKLIYDYVLGADIKWDLVVESVTNAWGVWAELQELIRWMRKYNESAPDGQKLKFYGMDGSGNWYHMKHAYTTIHEYLTEVDEKLARQFRDDFETELQEIRFETRTDVDEKRWQRLIANTSLLICRMEQGRVEYAAKSSQDAYEWALRFAQTLRDLVLNLAQAGPDFQKVFGTFWNTRDAAMAEHLEWIVQREGLEEGFLVGAHNFHFQQHPFGVTEQKATTMGSYFTSRVGRENVLVIGTNSAQATRGDEPLRESSNYAYNQVGPESYFLDLRSAPTSGPVREWLGEAREERGNVMYQSVAPGIAWDCLFFHRTISIATLDLPASLTIGRGTAETGRFKDYAGRYSIVSFLDFSSNLDIVCDGDKLYADGSADTFGELFPPFRVQLHPSDDGRFLWPNWPANLQFHGEGRTDRFTLIMPGMGTYEGLRVET